MRKIPDQAIDLIIKSEGWKAEPYYDTNNIPTIGYGTTAYPNGKPVSINDSKITKSDAEIYLIHSVQYVANTIEKYLKKIGLELNDDQFSALISFGYNLGTAPIVGKMRSMNSALLSKDFNKIANAFELYVYDKRKVKLAGLVARRKQEKNLFLKGIL